MKTPIQQTEPFLDALAARTPVPGGGAAIALTGAVAAALGSMVVEFSLGRRSNDAEAIEELERAAADFRQFRQDFFGLAEADSAAYAALREALKVPDDDPERVGKVRAAAASACQPPAGVLAAAGSVLGTLACVATVANPFLISDLRIAADLAMAVARGAVHTIEANIPLVGDESFAAAFRGALGRVETLHQAVVTARP